MSDRLKRILSLAKIYIPEEEYPQLERHFEKVLKMVERLKEVDTEGVEPIYYPHEDTFLRMREDTPGESLQKMDVLQNAPETFTDFIKAPSPLKGVAKKPK
ncbi:MAG: Asp-tRNA(Asn)/Glu-tRNA(Gln) amidotransferase subunit GatC [Candidatus Hydrothermia bacterium]|jgi:aspartyl-tRNA(Asn)/glutamyl-tRNA(Gln) amidotransferase subunit C